MKKSVGMILIAGSLMAAVLSGCSSSPSAEELQQLEALKAEVASLESRINALESEKASLTKAIADKNAMVEQCAKDKALVEQRLKSMQ
jgi:outer membrane murein-binding lipoprotein Lpp